MKKRYVDYALYNIWANDRLINDLSQQDDEILTRKVSGSFPSIQATVLHIWFAETGWLSRLNNKGWETSKITNFSGMTKALFDEWKLTSEEFKNFVIDSDLEKEIQFEHKGETFSVPSREIMQTVFNHGSYHRGQVVMMMRQLGITEISQTDYIEWVREKERGNL